ncbi:MAG: hypothetical protein HOH74_17765 [Gemmatimonadetes bacterium]|jgi:hypothetical protein|nr:hypothetical protein [Gemmatimonadota bacterium]
MVDIPPDLITQLRYHSEPYTRHRIIVDVVGRERSSKEARILRDEVRESVLAKVMMADRDGGGRIALDANHEWRGAHWVLSVLADLNYREGDKGLIPLRDQVYEWLFSPAYEQEIRERYVNDLHRCHAAQEGNAIFYLLRLGLADERVDELVARLLAWQWPDGGWNSELKPKADASSILDTLWPMRGLTLHAQLTGSEVSRDAAQRAAEVLLERRLYKHPKDGKVIKSDFTALHYPCYWHYDILFGLKAMAEADRIDDERCSDALDLLESKQLPDGGFPSQGKYYRVGRDAGVGTNLINWGGTSCTKMNEHITAEALGVLKASGRLTAIGL